jgi:hypothetical protein
MATPTVARDSTVTVTATAMRGSKAAPMAERSLVRLTLARRMQSVVR